MPIGLPSAGERRPADFEAREFVGVRRNSVFFTPSQALLAMESLGEANRLARKEGWPGVAAQAFALRSRSWSFSQSQRSTNGSVRFTQRCPSLTPRDPNLSGRSLAGMVWPSDGKSLRLMAFLFQITWGPGGKADAADVLNATIAAWSAMRLAGNVGASLPKDAGRIVGADMAITVLSFAGRSHITTRFCARSVRERVENRGK